MSIKTRSGGISTRGGGGSGGSCDVTYTNTTPVPETIGGIEANTTFDGVSIQDVLTDLLYPYQEPSFNSFNMQGLSKTTYSLGETFSGGSSTFTWSTTNSSNVEVDSVTLNGEGGLSNTGNYVQTLSPVTNNTVTTQTYSISARNTEGDTFSRSLSLSWRLKRYWIASDKQTLNDTDIYTASNEFSGSRNKSITYDCTGGKYFYIAYPASFGKMNNTKINNLSWNDWVLTEREILLTLLVSQSLFISIEVSTFLMGQ